MTGLGMETLRPGDIGFGPIDNSLPRWLPPWARFVPGTFPVDMGQLLLAGQKRVERDIDHAYVVVQAARQGYDLPGVMRAGARIVQAMPSGAEEIEIGAERWTERYVYVRPRYDLMFKAETNGVAVAMYARAYIGTPYSFLDYAAIAGLHAGIENGPVRRYVRSTGHMICSQLVDQALTDAGFHVFTDGRLPQDVMPIELYRKLTSMPGTLVLHPGDDDWYPEAS